MKVVVFDDGGLMGAETALWVRDHGHEVDLISAPGGLDSLAREEIAESLRDCSVVIDLSRQPSLNTGIATDDHGRVMDEEGLVASWRRSTSALLQAETAAGVGHHVSLSVVGVDRVRSEGAFRALQAHETMIQRSGISYSIVRSTQMFESAEDIATAGTEDWIVWVPPVEVRPVSLTDVAILLAHTAVSRPLIGVREIAGPEKFRLDAFVRAALTAVHAEHRHVYTDVRSPFFGARLRPTDLLPGAGAFIAQTSYRAWCASRPGRESTEGRGIGEHPDGAYRPRHGSSDDGCSRE
ncbi:SDR family oxidoreductase [Streptomyces olivaceoviridis]|uniref:SDR family oxidoreductase n=1 Tax=Streptomyces olivaceoviridis TaxID=1921 RepID=UPI0036A7BA53